MNHLNAIVSATVFALLGTLLPATAAAQANEWDSAKRDIESYRQELIRLLKERRPGTDGQILPKITGMQNILDRNINGFLTRNNMTSEKDAAKKYYEILRTFERESIKNGWIPYLQKWDAVKKNCEYFVKTSTERETQILTTIKEKINPQMKAAFERLRDAKMPAAPVLAGMKKLEDETLPQAEKVLDDLKELGDDAIGFRSKPIDEIKALLYRAKDWARGGNKEMDEVSQVLKKSVEEATSEIEKTLKPLNDRFRNIMLGSREHKLWVEYKKALMETHKYIRELLRSDKGYGFERAQLDAAMTKLCENIDKTCSFKQSDIEQFQKAEQSIVDTSKQYRLDPPRWVLDALKILDALKNRGEELTKLRDEMADLTKKHDTFNRECDSGCNETEKFVHEQDDLEGFYGAMLKMDEVEDAFEARLGKLNDEFKQVAELLRSLSRINKLRGVGEGIIAAIFRQCASAQKATTAMREQLEADPQVEAVLEGHNGE
ncbi:MAG: hypothetical protein AB7K09_00745 [Planctomycetota bacterium]